MQSINCKGKLLNLNKSLVMGIINITNDSFFEDSRKTNVDAVLQATQQMINDGASIIDIGAQSTRPNSIRLTAAEEIEQLKHILPIVTTTFPTTVFSIDTYHSKVAEFACSNGVSIVNDISGGEDNKMLETVAAHSVPYICMHTSNNLNNMHQTDSNKNIIEEVLQYFIVKKQQCLQAGIKDFIIDVGIGFGKTVEQNFELINNLSIFKMLKSPVLIGISRKSFIYNTLNITANQALNGTTALHSLCIKNGANILRVHDVKEAVEVIELINYIST